MVLKYLDQNINLEETETVVPQTVSKKAKKRQIFCLLLLANIIVWNALYGICTAEKDKPIWEVVTTDNLIYKLWQKYPLISKSSCKGMVTGILFNETNPLALINNKLVHEGDTIDSIKIVKINPKKIKFEKNGLMWTQKILETPNVVW